jgi:hypothetical protein
MTFGKYTLLRAAPQQVFRPRRIARTGAPTKLTLAEGDRLPRGRVHTLSGWDRGRSVCSPAL